MDEHEDSDVLSFHFTAGEPPYPYRVKDNSDYTILSTVTPCDAIRIVNGRVLTFPIHCPLCDETFEQDVSAYGMHCQQHIDEM